MGMSPKEIWCNEAQERYVLAIKKIDLDLFERICKRERCPFAVVGHATKDQKLIVTDTLTDTEVINMSLDALLGKPPRTKKSISKPDIKKIAVSFRNFSLAEHIERVLKYPAVASKSFLITIGDRSVTGLISRDQMVGPWQIPVSNVAVTKSDFKSNTGETFAVGEKTPLAIINASASAKMAVGEALTNIVASPIDDISHIKLSANWMAASGDNENDYALYEAVKSIGMELCPDLQISIPVGKDSLSMQTRWEDANNNYTVASPLSLVISAFAECSNTRKVLTPQLQQNKNTTLLLIDLSGKKKSNGWIFVSLNSE
jgi:phosphoribosylformylglycinamidine synthase